MNGRPSDQTRRKLILSAASIGATGVLAAVFPWREIQTNPQRHKSILRGGFFHRPPDYVLGTYYQPTEALQKFAFEWNLKSGKGQVVEATTPIHIVDTNPIDKNISVTSTQKTNRVSLIDWSTRKEVVSTVLPEQAYFYGHSAFVESGDKFVAPLRNAEANAGLGVFDVPSLRQVDFIPTDIGPAHDIHQIGNDVFLFGVATPVGTPGLVGTLDLKTRLVRYFKTGYGNESRINVVAHLSDCGSHLIANSQQLGPSGFLTNGALISFDKNTSVVKTFIERGVLDFNTDMLSIDFDPLTNFAWITVPDQNRIEVWDLRAGSHVRSLSFENGIRPTAVSHMSETEEVAVTSQNKFFVFDAKTALRNETREQFYPHHLLNGGHCAHTRIV